MFPVGSLFRRRVSHHLGRATFPAPASSNAACGFPALRSPVCFASRIMGPLSLRLDVYSPPQVLQIDGRLCHLVLAFLVVGDFTNSRAPSLHGRYPASTLLRTHPSPSRLRSTSRLSRLYDRPCSDDFSSGRGGLLQLLGMSLSPCCRFPPRRSVGAASIRFRLPMLPSPSGWGLGLRGYALSRPLLRSLLLRPGELVASPRETLSIGFRVLRFPATLLSKLRGF